jgi:hypothetical protein
VTFLAPWALGIAAAVSAMVVALHILASSNPRVTLLPTARFIPDHAALATSRAFRLTDPLLLLLRVAVVMLAGLAFARPVLAGARRPVGRVVIVDQSRAVRSRAEAADSAARLLGRGDVLVAFDSAARIVHGASADSLRRGAASHAAGSLSAALAAGARSAASLRGDADSVELVLVSPLAAEEWDAATSAIRATWRGRVRVVRIAPAAGAAGARGRVEVLRASAADPVRAATALLGGAAGVARIDRGAPGSADSGWARGDARTLVRWPAVLDASGWKTRARADSAGALVAGEGDGAVVVVAPFVRTAEPPGGRVIARWVDGAPAATERVAEAGCVRDVAVALPAAGDLALRESVRRMVATLTAPCGGLASGTPLGDSAVRELRGSGALVASRAIAGRAIAGRAVPAGGLTTWLLAAALVLLLAEPMFRRSRVAA